MIFYIATHWLYSQFIYRMSEPILVVRQFASYASHLSQKVNDLVLHKRRLANTVGKIQEMIECFKLIDLDKKGVIYPNILQNYLISNKYYFNPQSINLYYHKYSHQKGYLAYEDILEALLPSNDLILAQRTLTQSRRKTSSFSHNCHQQRIESITYLTAFIISQEINVLNQDYAMMQKITMNSQRIGATLWRQLDRNHTNQLNFQSLRITALEVGVKLEEWQWAHLLYWHFHSYKKTFRRDDFMKIMNIQEQKKRSSSECRVDMYKLEQGLYQRAAEDRARSGRIESAVRAKVAMMPHLQRQAILMVQQQHFPFARLQQKRLLSGKKGYSNPKQMVKYVVERH